jgi:hypothetical protein
MEKQGLRDRLRRRHKAKAGDSSSVSQLGNTVKAANEQSQSPALVAKPKKQAKVDRIDVTPAVLVTRRDYWAGAGAKLRQSKPEIHEKLVLAIEEGSHSSGTLEERIRFVLSDSIATITDRQWRIRWGARLDVPMRGILAGVVKALEKFKDVGSAAASLDPTYARIPVAAICVLLPLALNLPNQEDAMKVGLDKIATIVTRYSAMEIAYTRQGDLSLSKNCEDAIVDLYTKILEYQAIAAAFLGKRTPGRYISAVVNPKDFEAAERGARVG